MGNVNPNTTVNGANPASVTADANALVVIPDGGQLQHQTANHNALVSIPDYGCAAWFWAYACGLRFCGIAHGFWSV